MELTADNYQVGKVAYDAYAKQAGGVSLATGDKLPEFADLTYGIQEAWASAGVAVVLFAMEWMRAASQKLSS